MHSDEEKDIYIKVKLKDNYIPEKIDNLFNNSIDLIKNEGGKNMEENQANENKYNRKTKFMQRIVAFAACAVIALGGGQIYASTQGYGNIFFMIKYLITGDETVITDKNEILSDRDISISYEPIKVTLNVAMQVKKLQVKDTQATLMLELRESDVKEKMTYLAYTVKDENGNQLFSNVLNYGDVNGDGEINENDVNYLSDYLANNNDDEKILDNADVNKDGKINLKDVTVLQRYLSKTEGYETLPYIENTQGGDIIGYTEDLILQGFKDNTKKLILEIYNSNSKQILKLNIDLEKRTIDVEGEGEALEKISEIELKEFLEYMPLLYDVNGKMMDDDWKIWAAIIVSNHLPEHTLECFEVGRPGFYGYKVADVNLILDNIYGIKIEEFEETEENDFTIYEKNGEKYFITSYAGGLPGPAECIDITNVSYSGGLYTATYTYCQLNDMVTIFEIDINDYDIYEQTVTFELNKGENSIFKFKRVSSQPPVVIKSKEEKEEGAIKDDILIPNDTTEKDRETVKNYFQGKWKEKVNGEILIIKDDMSFSLTNNDTVWNGTFTLKGDSSNDVPHIILDYGNGEVYDFRLEQAGSSYLVSNDVANEYEFVSEEDYSDSSEKVDNYASTMSWTEYWAPGLKFKYPTIFNLEEVGGYYRGSNQGAISTIISGVAKGIDPDTKRIIESNLQINIYEPIYKEGFDENSIIDKSGFTNSKGMKWYCIDHNSEKEEYVYYNNNWEYRIQFTWEGQRSYKITNIINWMLGSTEIGSY